MNDDDDEDVQAPGSGDEEGEHLTDCVPHNLRVVIEVGTITLDASWNGRSVAFKWSMDWCWGTITMTAKDLKSNKTTKC